MAKKSNQKENEKELEIVQDVNIENNETETAITNDVIEDAPEIEDISEPNVDMDAKKVEDEVLGMINAVASEVTENISEIKKQESKILKDIEENPESAQAILEAEINRVNDVIKNVEGQVDEYVKQIKKNKVNYTTTSWNGWGYDF